jgi:hypothetical protein
MMGWFRIYGHPAGAGTEPWYTEDGDRVYRARIHPRRSSVTPDFEIRDRLVFNLDGHVGATSEPWFRMAGSLVYSCVGHPDGEANAPWYQRRPLTRLV